MTLVEIAALPIGELAHPDLCRLFLWITMPLLDRVPELLRRMGLSLLHRAAVAQGLAERRRLVLDAGILRGRHRLRNPQHEARFKSSPSAVGRSGSATGNSPSISSRRAASIAASPTAFGTRSLRLFDGPRCELFARSRHPGFDSWGNQIDLFGEFEGNATVQSRSINNEKGRHGLHPEAAQKDHIRNGIHTTPQRG